MKLTKQRAPGLEAEDDAKPEGRPKAWLYPPETEEQAV